ncbi:MAG: hypothetical protein ACREV9_06710 [Burkholderiales bacterium]
MAAVRQALELTLKHHEPFPALVVNPSWGMALDNDAAGRLLSLLGDPRQVWARVDASGEFNVMRMTFHPQGMQPLLRNWEQVATLLLSRLQREVSADPVNAKLRSVFNENIAYSGIPRWRSTAGLPRRRPPCPWSSGWAIPCSSCSPCSRLSARLWTLRRTNCESKPSFPRMTSPRSSFGGWPAHNYWSSRAQSSRVHMP